MSFFSTQSCNIYRNVEGYTDPETGEWIPAGEHLVAIVEADIQPKSGRQRAAELQTEYESDYVAFVDNNDIVFEAGYSEIKQGYIFIDEDEKEYDIVFPGDWGDHFEFELKEK